MDYFVSSEIEVADADRCVLVSIGYPKCAQAYRAIVCTCECVCVLGLFLA